MRTTGRISLWLLDVHTRVEERQEWEPGFLLPRHGTGDEAGARMDAARRHTGRQTQKERATRVRGHTRLRLRLRPGRVAQPPGAPLEPRARCLHPIRQRNQAPRRSGWSPNQTRTKQATSGARRGDVGMPCAQQRRGALEGLRSRPEGAPSAQTKIRNDSVGRRPRNGIHICEATGIQTKLWEERRALRTNSS